MLINKMQRYLKFSNYFLKNNKLSIRKKRVSINNNILPILIILFISFIYFLITGVKLYTTVLLIFMTEVYLIFKFNSLLREINGNIDNRFEFEKTVREKQKRMLIEHVPTNWTEKMKTVWRYIFLWEEKVNSH